MLKCWVFTQDSYLGKKQRKATFLLASCQPPQRMNCSQGLILLVFYRKTQVHFAVFHPDEFEVRDCCQPL